MNPTPTLRRSVPYAGALLLVLLFGIPVYWIVLSSFLPKNDVLSVPPTWFTLHPTIDSWQRTADQIPVWGYLKNSIIFATFSAAGSVLLSFLAAYVFSRVRFRGSGILMLVFLLSLALPQIATSIPLFRIFNDVGLTNTRLGLIILQASIMIPFTVWTLISFVEEVPRELEDAARIDGANLWQVLWLVVSPLMMPAFVTMFLVNFIVTWNELFYPLIFASSAKVRPLTVGLTQLTVVNSGTSARPWDLMSTLSAFMIVPIIMLVAIGQRRIIAGLTAGAIK